MINIVYMSVDDDLITITEARKLLGYASNKSVHDLIARDRLRSWKYPHRKRHLVSLKEVNSLQEPILVSPKRPVGWRHQMNSEVNNEAQDAEN